MREIQTVIQQFSEDGFIVEKAAIDFIGRNISRIKELSGDIKPEDKVISKGYLSGIISSEKKIEVIKTHIKTAKDYEAHIEVESTFEDTQESKKKDTNSFVDFFRSRYDNTKKLLMNRPEMKNAISISRLLKNDSMRDVSAIGMVYDVRETKNKNILIILEDITGKVKVLIKREKSLDAEKVIKDEIIGVSGNFSNGFLFADSITWPEIPLPQGVNTISDPVNAVFIADTHYGSKEFMKPVEERFLKWLKSGKEDAQKVKYIFIAGDLVDGVGVYPRQKKDLTHTDIYDQYALFEQFVEKIPEHIELIVCPGNHDAVRQAEPQPPISEDFAPGLCKMSNVRLVSNPATVRINGSKKGAIRVLMYHGYSFNRIINEVDYLRKQGMEAPQHVMKDVLRRRHLAPLYGSTIISPEGTDRHFIGDVPDIFQTADLHSFALDNHKGVTLISSSTFQAQTDFQVRVGHKPVPGKVTVVDLQTRRTKIIDLVSQAA